MDKYSKTLIMLFKVPFGIFCILLGLSFIGVSVWVSTFSNVASMIFLISLLGGGFIINYGIGYAFLGDEYKLSKYVRDGNSTFDVVETPKFLKRRKVVTFIGFIAYILLAVYYIVRTIIQLAIVNSLANSWVLIIFAFVALVFAFIFFLIYKKTKHIDLNQK